MKAIVKISALLAILLIFIWFSSIVYVNMTRMQIVILLISLIFFLNRFGLWKELSELKLFMPFAASMLLVYFLIGLSGFPLPKNVQDQTWLLYGLNRCLLFISTIIFFQFALSFIDINDIMDLPMNIHKRKYLLLGRALFNLAVSNLDNLEFHLRLMPEYQRRRLSTRQYFNLKLQLTYSILLMIVRESKQRGEMIDNRVKHCFSGMNQTNKTGA